MSNTIIYTRCEQCKGVGTWTPEGQEQQSCITCHGIGSFSLNFFNIDDVVGGINDKLDTLLENQIIDGGGA